MENDISDIIKEAKQLYFARKKRRKQMSAMGIMFVVAALVVLPFLNAENQPYIYNFSQMDEDINLTQTGSVIEDMGFPTDEYGLLRIS